MATEAETPRTRCVRGMPGMVLAIFAHPDDAEFACGGTVAAWARSGAEVVSVACTDGDKGADELPLGNLADWMARCNQEYGVRAGCAYAEAFKALRPFCQV